VPVSNGIAALLQSRSVLTLTFAAHYYPCSKEISCVTLRRAPCSTNFDLDYSLNLHMKQQIEVEVADYLWVLIAIMYTVLRSGCPLLLHLALVLLLTTFMILEYQEVGCLCDILEIVIKCKHLDPVSCYPLSFSICILRARFCVNSTKPAR
jgi:hypothetical protein